MARYNGSTIDYCEKVWNWIFLDNYIYGSFDILSNNSYF